jgi:hypothetical protein
MVYQCQLCMLDPKNHSFHKVLQTENDIYFYSKPSDAKLYFDKNSIIKHYEGMLNEVPETIHWTWIFDCDEFGLKHSLHVDVALGLAKLIQDKYSNNLRKIVIINANIYIWTIYKIVSPFFNKNVIEFHEGASFPEPLTHLWEK